ncbi:MAG: hypothetical protein KGZ67_01840 [Hydrogenophaga sp.]|jgi:hypothetical protein|nr:hypothetical protein [Hydrogenophaga sp.]
MNALKKARKLIEHHPLSEAAGTVAALVVALESDTAFELGSLYRLSDDDFALTLQLLDEWRVDRHHARKLRLLDVSVQVDGLRQGDPAQLPETA